MRRGETEIQITDHRREKTSQITEKKKRDGAKRDNKLRENKERQEREIK